VDKLTADKVSDNGPKDAKDKRGRSKTIRHPASHTMQTTISRMLKTRDGIKAIGEQNQE